jgi:aquaporin NIP
MGAEALGAFTLVAAGGFAITALEGQAALIGVPIVFGVVVGLLVYTLSSTSGAQLNPAITLALTLTRRHPIKWVVPYWLAQLFGAFCAAAFVIMIRADELALLTRPAATVQSSHAVLLELLATGILGFVIAYAADAKRSDGSVPAAPVGAAILLGALFAGPLTGGSMNPARSIGPALTAGEFGGLWIYLVGPFLGAAIGMYLHDLLVRPHPFVVVTPEKDQEMTMTEGSP